MPARSSRSRVLRVVVAPVVRGCGRGTAIRSRADRRSSMVGGSYSGLNEAGPQLGDGGVGVVVVGGSGGEDRGQGEHDFAR